MRANLSREIRAMPNVEYMAPWYQDANFQPAMPYEIWETLSPHARQISMLTRFPPGVRPHSSVYFERKMRVH
jgi:hypothetical protein